MIPLCGRALSSAPLCRSVSDNILDVKDHRTYVWCGKGGDDQSIYSRSVYMITIRNEIEI